jgi:hypothetical protein
MREVKVEPALIGAEATQLQGIDVGAERAAEIAAEVEVLLTGVERVVETIGLFDEPDGFRAALWELREKGARR